MHSTLMRRLRGSSPRDGRRGEAGFTLIELLVVISIMGILASIVVFAVRGVGDRGRGSAVATDQRILRTAEEAYCAKNGTYANLAQLLGPPSFIASTPTYDSVVRTDSGNCGGTGYLIGTPTFTSTTDPNAPTILAANNVTEAFNFLAQGFIASYGTARFTFASPGSLQTTLRTTDPATTHNVLFASTEQTNVNGVVPQASGGSCTAANCPGIAGTQQVYAYGQLAAYACSNPGGVTLSGRTCAQPNASTGGGYVPTLTSIGDVVGQLQAGRTLTLGQAGSTYALAAQQALTAAATAQAWTDWTTGTNVSGLNPAGTVLITNNTNTDAALQQVQSGAYAMAMVPLTNVKSPNVSDGNNWVHIPDVSGGTTYYTAPAYRAVVLGGNGDTAMGTNFMTYLTGPSGRAVMTAYGYRAP